MRFVDFNYLQPGIDACLYSVWPVTLAGYMNTLHTGVYSGAVSLDGRIEPGDMILEVNGVSFENLSNDEAVRILRDVVQKSG